MGREEEEICWSESSARTKESGSGSSQSGPGDSAVSISGRGACVYFYIFFIFCDRWLGKSAGPVRPSPEDRGGRAQETGARADQPDAEVFGCHSRGHHRNHHGGPIQSFDCGEYAAAKPILNML